MTIKTPQNKTILILALTAIAFYSAFVGDKTTLSMVAGAFIALLKQDE